MRALLIGSLLLAALPSSASAAADIEKVWKFQEGQVAIQAQSDGTFLGTVIRDTRFSQCTHAAGERMWTGVTAQSDGSYWGGHQWFNTADCSPKSPPGKTAFRVMAKPDGTKFLRVCFASPESGLQPTIAPDGTSTQTTASCDDSELVGELPASTPKIDTIATLPKQGKKRCLSKRSFRIRLKEPPGDALATATVYVNGKRVKVIRRDRISAPVNLTGLPKGRYTVRIVAKTVLGKTITGTRKYRTCTRKRRSSSRSPV
jgi:hypothetical protein